MREQSPSARQGRGLAAFGAMVLLMTCGSLGGCISDDAVERELRADAAAIQQDKAQLDIDLKKSADAAVLERDKHKLYLDVEKQEHDRGTEDDEFAEGAN